jgi:hypothetical protein
MSKRIADNRKQHCYVREMRICSELRFDPSAEKPVIQARNSCNFELVIELVAEMSELVGKTSEAENTDSGDRLGRSSDNQQGWCDVWASHPDDPRVRLQA